MHRITLLLFGLFFLVQSAKAQQNTSSLLNAKIKDGTIMMGGSLSGSYQKYKYHNLKTNQQETGDLIRASFSAKGGYFFLPDFVVGLNVAVDHTSINVDSTFYGPKTTFLLAGPFVRYYLNNGIFGELNVNAGVNTVKGADKTDIKSGAVGIGYAYFLNPHIAIEPMLSVNYVSSRVDNADRDQRDTQFGPILNIGIQAYIWAPTRVLPTK